MDRKMQHSNYFSHSLWKWKNCYILSFYDNESGKLLFYSDIWKVKNSKILIFKNIQYLENIIILDFFNLRMQRSKNTYLKFECYNNNTYIYIL